MQQITKEEACKLICNILDIAKDSKEDVIKQELRDMRNEELN